MIKFSFPEIDHDIGWKFIDHEYPGMLYYYSHQWQSDLAGNRFTNLIVWMSDRQGPWEGEDDFD